MDPTVDRWRAAGHMVHLDDHDLDVFAIDRGDASAPPERTLLLLHGFPESSFSYHKVVDELADHFDRLVLFDVPGYGFSPAPRSASFSIPAQTDRTLALYRLLGVQGGHVISHDMSDSIHTELIARHAEGATDLDIRSSVFTNGNMVVELADLRIVQKLLLGPLGPLVSRLNNRWITARQIRSANGSARLTPTDIRRMWWIASVNDLPGKADRIIRYYEDRLRFQDARWFPALRAASHPVHIVWGDRDRVSPPAVARRLQRDVLPDTEIRWVEGGGHFCQLDAPEAWRSAVLDVLGAPSSDT